MATRRTGTAVKTVEAPAKSAQLSQARLHVSNPAAERRIKLLTREEVPDWCAHNDDPVRTGYRPIRGSVQFCFESLCYIHNETVNIYSHLIPAVAALTYMFFVDNHFSGLYPDAPKEDRLALRIFLIGSAFCFTASSFYHTFLCHSAHYAELWVRIDYIGIVFQTLCCFLSGIYASFYCEPTLRMIYWTMIGSLCVVCGFIVLNPKLQARKWRFLRLCAFIGLSLSAVGPVANAFILFPDDLLYNGTGMPFYLLEGLFMIIGATLYGSHFPESWMPHKFDIWGSSHQLFHICVVCAGASHGYGVLTALAYNNSNPRCPA